MTDRSNSLLRVGIIGAGGVATKYHLPVLLNLPDVRVEWIVDVNKARAAQVARAFKVQGAFARIEEVGEVDAVLLAIPVGARERSWELAFERGWHVLSEKPFATNHARHREIVARATAKGQRIAVGQMRRYYPSTEICRRVVGSGIFGPLKEIIANEGGRMRGTGRGHDWYQGSAEQSGGGGMAETGCHLIDQVLYSSSAERFQFESATGTFVDGIDFDGVIHSHAVFGSALRVPCQFGISRTVNRRTGIHFKYDNCFISMSVGIADSVTVSNNKGELMATMRSEGAADVSIYRAFARQWIDFVQWCQGKGDCRIAATKVEPVTEMLDQFYARAHRSEGGVL